MYADGNTTKSRVIRKAESLRAPNGKTFRRISNVLCALSEKTSSRQNSFSALN